MGRTLEQIIGDLPKERQKRIGARYSAMKDELESLSQLREISGKAQADVAAALNIKQPSVSKIEKQADMYLSTLRDYVKAIGGELDLVVRLPNHRALRINRLGDVYASSSPRASGKGDDTHKPVRRQSAARSGRA